MSEGKEKPYIVKGAILTLDHREAGGLRMGIATEDVFDREAFVSCVEWKPEADGLEKLGADVFQLFPEMVEGILPQTIPEELKERFEKIVATEEAANHRREAAMT